MDSFNFCCYEEIFFIFGWLITIKHKYSKREIKTQRLGDDFSGLAGDSVYQEAPEVISRGSWWLCNPFLVRHRLICLLFMYLSIYLSKHVCSLLQPLSSFSFTWASGFFASKGLSTIFQGTLYLNSNMPDLHL